MKKNFFAGIAAVAMSAVCAFGLAACKPDNNNNNNNDDPPVTVGDTSVLTEEQWVAAWQDSAAATNYKMVKDVTQTGEFFDVTSENGVIVSGSMSGTLEFSRDGYTAYIKQAVATDYDDEEPQNITSEMYIEVSGSLLNVYMGEESLGWMLVSQDARIPEVAQAAFIMAIPELGELSSLLAEEYSGTGENSNVTGTLDELFSLFTFDSKTKVYSATLSQEGVAMEVEIAFTNGKLCWYAAEGDYADATTGEDYTMVGEVTFTYGGVSVVVPEEVKNTAIEIPM